MGCCKDTLQHCPLCFFVSLCVLFLYFICLNFSSSLVLHGQSGAIQKWARWKDWSRSYDAQVRGSLAAICYFLYPGCSLSWDTSTKRVVWDYAHFWRHIIHHPFNDSTNYEKDRLLQASIILISQTQKQKMNCSDNLMRVHVEHSFSWRKSNYRPELFHQAL